MISKQSLPGDDVWYLLHCVSLHFVINRQTHRSSNQDRLILVEGWTRKCGASTIDNLQNNIFTQWWVLGSTTWIGLDWRRGSNIPSKLSGVNISLYCVTKHIADYTRTFVNYFILILGIGYWILLPSGWYFKQIMWFADLMNTLLLVISSFPYGHLNQCDTTMTTMCVNNLLSWSCFIYSHPP
jgi:flagellar biosynthesis protein FliQ